MHPFSKLTMTVENVLFRDTNTARMEPPFATFAANVEPETLANSIEYLLTIQYLGELLIMVVKMLWTYSVYWRRDAKIPALPGPCNAASGLSGNFGGFEVGNLAIMEKEHSPYAATTVDKVLLLKSAKHDLYLSR